MTALGVALIARGRPDGLRASLVAYGAALEAVEQAGQETRAVVLDATEGQEAAAVLSDIDGAERLVVDPAEGDVAAWARAVAAPLADCELILLASTDSAPAPGALLALHAAALRSGADLMLADPSEPAPYALVRRVAMCPPDPASPASAPVLSLARALRDRGGQVACAVGAGQSLADTVAPVAAAAHTGAQIGCLDPEQIQVGTATYFGGGTLLRTWGSLERIRVGAYCSFADDIKVQHLGKGFTDREGRVLRGGPWRGAHNMASATTFPIGTLVPDELYPEYIPLDGSVVAVPLEIGSDVWVGTGAFVLGAVTIGHGAVIGAKAVVTRDVAPYTIVAGNPAQVVRRRFDDRTCERLLALRWWEWDPALVRSNHRWFALPAAAFADRYDPAGALDPPA